MAGAYVVMVDDQPVLYIERGGRGLVTLVDAPAAIDLPSGSRDGLRAGRIGGGSEPLGKALRALAEAARAGRVGKLALECIDGEPASASELAGALVELGFQCGPRSLTLTA